MGSARDVHAAEEHLDVVVVGAGMSGIGMACALSTERPDTTYAILEARADLGGTWDLFRYPGVRSDSDMYTLGYRFRPWSRPDAVAGGDTILSYVRETADEFGVTSRIRYRQRVVRAAWSSTSARWRLEIASTGADGAPDGPPTRTLTCSFLVMASGYYRYDAGYSPDLPGLADFGGLVVHPQHWPQDLDLGGRKVVVVGSGATAMTLVPALAGTAAHVTMLQRSPSYALALPGVDPVTVALTRRLPAKLAYLLTRWRNIMATTIGFQLSRRFPGLVRRVLRGAAKAALPRGYDVDTHFNPSYDPWDQRLSVVPDGDLFAALSRGDASVVTDAITGFSSHGVRLASGAELPADVLVTATGLNMELFHGVQLTVDGEPVDVPEAMVYKGMMLSGVPNLAFLVGYTHASWTLKAGLVSEYVCRLLAHLESRGFDAVVAEPDPSVGEAPFLDFGGNYAQRAAHLLPRQGTAAPWRLSANYLLDSVRMRRGRLDDGTVRFLRAGAPVARVSRPAAPIRAPAPRPRRDGGPQP